jgi:hypothetical protein
VVEHVNDFDAWVAIAPVGFRVVDRLWFVAGPGFETESRRPSHEEDGGHEVVEHSAEIHEEEQGDPFFLWRFGLGYSIHLNHSLGLMPSFNLDLVRGARRVGGGLGLRGESDVPLLSPGD